MARDSIGVYLDTGGRFHSLWAALVDHPPPGVRIILPAGAYQSIVRRLALRRNVIDKLYGSLSSAIPVTLVKAFLESGQKRPEGADVTLATGHIVFRKEPWILELESAAHPLSYNLRHMRLWGNTLKKKLKAPTCRRIICWTEASRKTIEWVFADPEITAKAAVVPLAVPPKARSSAEVTIQKKIAFIGSVNLPGQFGLKGGHEVVAAFNVLKRTHPDLKLFIRSDVPASVRSWARTQPNVLLIDQRVPWEQIDNELRTSMVFVFPGYSTPALSFLDAMSYGLPIVATDVWANREMVHHGVNGILLRPSQRVSLTDERGQPIFDARPNSRRFRRPDPYVISDLVEALDELLRDPAKAKMLGAAGQEQVNHGRFSLHRRNARLAEIFQDAIH